MLRAVIFDFNGVIIDDEHLHFQAFQKVLREAGFEFSERDYFGTYLGLDDRGCFAAVLTDRGQPTKTSEVSDLVERKAIYYLQELDNGITLFPGVCGLVAALAAQYPLAICSGARQHEIEHVLTRSGLAPHFRVIVSADQIHAGKPDPTGYLATLAALRKHSPSLQDLSAGECLVFEDAPAGIQAAHSAGMRCVAVANSRKPEDLSHADLVVETLEHVTAQRILGVFDSNGP